MIESNIESVIECVIECVIGSVIVSVISAWDRMRDGDCDREVLVL